MNLEFLSTVAVIAPDPSASRELYVGAPRAAARGSSEWLSPQRTDRRLQVVRDLAAIPRPPRRAPAPQSGRLSSVPQVSIEFDVEDAAVVGPAALKLEQAGY